MRTEQDILRKFAKEIAEHISRKTISALQKVTDVLSGDDSGLKNVWDEICVQVLYEQFIVWETYDEIVRAFVLGYVEELQSHEKLVLWFQTEEGWNWLYDYGERSDEQPPVFVDDIVKYLVQEYVYDKAGKWTNERIRAYLERSCFD